MPFGGIALIAFGGWRIVTLRLPVASYPAFALPRPFSPISGKDILANHALVGFV